MGVTLNSPGLNFVVQDYKFVVRDYIKFTFCSPGLHFYFLQSGTIFLVFVVQDYIFTFFVVQDYIFTFCSPGLHFYFLQSRTTFLLFVVQDYQAISRISQGLFWRHQTYFLAVLHFTTIISLKFFHRFKYFASIFTVELFHPHNFHHQQIILVLLGLRGVIWCPRLGWVRIGQVKLESFET